MIRVIRSELVRLRRRSTVLGWFGLTALFVVIINLFVFQSASSDGSSAAPPGGDFPTAAELAQSSGLMAGVSTVVSLLGVISLIFWALTTAGDFTSGLVRLTVQAEPRRWRLIVGKAAALTLWTGLASLIAVVVNLAVAPAVAGAFDISTEAWSKNAAQIVASGWANLFLALVVWGVIGLVIGVVTRSGGVAIGIGLGYALVFEPLLNQVASGAAEKLPASVLDALAAGGNSTLAYGTALTLAVGYVVVSLGAGTLVFVRRDVSD